MTYELYSETRNRRGQRTGVMHKEKNLRRLAGTVLTELIWSNCLPNQLCREVWASTYKQNRKQPVSQVLVYEGQRRYGQGSL